MRRLRSVLDSRVIRLGESSGLTTLPRDYQEQRTVKPPRASLGFPLGPDARPPACELSNGNNPLTLLHAALSEGLHAETDAQCLELAKSIRVVLADLVERMANTLKDEAELNAAVSRLLKERSQPKTK